MTKRYLNILSALFIIKNKRLRKASYSILGISLLYMGIITYPNFLFGYSHKYKNFNVYSTQPISNKIETILDSVTLKLSFSEIYDKELKHNLYLCNNYKLYVFLAPFSRTAFACNIPLSNNIFIANGDIERNEARKYADEQYIRRLRGVITHEITHTLVEKNLGFFKYLTLSTWKHEGYCEYIGYGKTDDINSGQHFFKTQRNLKTPCAEYRRYYITVNYLMTVEKMNYASLLASKLSFQDIMDKIEEKN